MAPISPSSSNSSPPLKRSSPSYTEEDAMVEATSKRRRLENIGPQTPPPDGPFIQHTTATPFFDDDPRLLLQRSVALALQHVGFDGASKEALVAMCSQVETCQYSHMYICRIPLTRSRCRALSFEYNHIYAKCKTTRTNAA